MAAKPHFQSYKIMVRNRSLEISNVMVKMTDSGRKQMQIFRDARHVVEPRNFLHNHERVQALQLMEISILNSAEQKKAFEVPYVIHRCFLIENIKI